MISSPLAMSLLATTAVLWPEKETRTVLGSQLWLRARAADGFSTEPMSRMFSG